MWPIAMLLVAGGMILVIELPFLVKQKQKKDLSIFIVMLLIGTVLQVLQLRDVKLPNPLNWIKVIVHPYQAFIEALFS